MSDASWQNYLRYHPEEPRYFWVQFHGKRRMCRLKQRGSSPADEDYFWQIVLDEDQSTVVCRGEGKFPGMAAHLDSLRQSRIESRNSEHYGGYAGYVPSPSSPHSPAYA